MLCNKWTLTNANKTIMTSIKIPGDIISALCEQNIIPDPYDNIDSVQWVSRENWTISQSFQFCEKDLNALILVFRMVDTFSNITINDSLVLTTTNCFEEYRIDILPFVMQGTNTIQITFFPAEMEAQKRASAYGESFPWAKGNNLIPNMNLIRKPQFQSGWDWGPCLVPCGIYEPIEVIKVRNSELVSLLVNPQLSGNRGIVTLTAKINHHVLNYSSSITFSFDHTSKIIEFSSNQNEIFCKFEIDSPKLWDTFDHGKPHLYPVSVSLESQTITKMIGFRTLELVTKDDQYGTSFEFRLNGRPITCKGASVIPFDSLPSRETPAVFRRYLVDARESNMNMVRVWGGGFYNHDSFYEICDELGILVWQDLMFACAQYPADGVFMEEVNRELEHQVTRLHSHPSIAIWCADNEVELALRWQTKNTKEDHDRYWRLCRMLRDKVVKLDPSRPFWCGTPFSGFEGIDPNDKSGTFHEWTPFLSCEKHTCFEKIIPRFCTEFGFESYPSLPTVRSFSNEDSIDAPIFSSRQRHPRGNQIIKKALEMYFGKSDFGFERTLYMSQVVQAIQIEHACDWYRINKPRCRGMLFWQLNDCWPVSSWSSIEYGGRWKLLQYRAVHFFDKLRFVFHDDGKMFSLFAVNDECEAIDIDLYVKLLDFGGNEINNWRASNTVQGDSSVIVWSIESSEVRNDGFYYVSFQGHDAFYLPGGYKVEKAEISMHVNGKEIIVESIDRPAFYVHLEHDDVLHFSDSGFVLIPGIQKKILSPIGLDRSIRVHQLGE